MQEVSQIIETIIFFIEYKGNKIEEEMHYRPTL